MTARPTPSSGLENEKETQISDQDLASIAGGQQIPDQQIAAWLAMLKDPKTPEDVRQRISARVLGRTVDGKLYDGSAPA